MDLLGCLQNTREKVSMCHCFHTTGRRIKGERSEKTFCIPQCTALQANGITLPKQSIDLLSLHTMHIYYFCKAVTNMSWAQSCCVAYKVHRGNAITYQVFHTSVFQGLSLVGCSKAASISVHATWSWRTAGPKPLTDQNMLKFPHTIMHAAGQRQGKQSKGWSLCSAATKTLLFPVGVRQDQSEMLCVALCSCVASFSGDDMSYFATAIPGSALFQRNGESPPAPTAWIFLKIVCLLPEEGADSPRKAQMKPAWEQHR